jgi:hypothetical protein
MSSSRLPDRPVVVQFDLSDGRALFTTADTERTEDAQRVEFISLCPLCVLCVSVVSALLHTLKTKLNHYLTAWMFVMSRRFNALSRLMTKIQAARVKNA